MEDGEKKKKREGMRFNERVKKRNVKEEREEKKGGK